MRFADEKATMRAVVRDRYGSPDVVGLAKVAKPVPGANEVLMKVEAASVNTADLDHLRGRPLLARVGTGILKPKHRVMGLAAAGVIEAVGAEVSRLQPGDQVWADLIGFGHGAFAEYVSAPETAFAPKPAGMTFEQAATFPHSAVLARQAFRSGRPIRPGHKVLIIGAGGCVGPFAIQIAKSFGAEVTGVDHAGKLEVMRSAGADHVIDYIREDVTRNGVAYDLILDIAEARSVLRYRRSLTDTGRYVLIARTLSGFFAAFFLGGLVAMMGSKTMGVFSWRPNDKGDLKFLGELFDEGKLTPLIDRHFNLGEVGDALRYQEDGHARGKLVITV